MWIFEWPLGWFRSGTVVDIQTPGLQYRMSENHLQYRTQLNKLHYRVPKD